MLRLSGDAANRDHYGSTTAYQAIHLASRYASKVSLPARVPSAPPNAPSLDVGGESRELELDISLGPKNGGASLQSLGNTEWLLNRAANRPAVAQPIGVLAPRVPARELVLPVAKALGVIPAWVLLTTVVLATTGICATAIMHSRTELRESSVQFANLEMQIASLQETNQTLQRDISRLTKDPTAIELAARERLGMVKASDIVVTMDSISRSRSTTSNVSFVR